MALGLLGAALFGVAGAFLAVPVIAMLLALLNIYGHRYELLPEIVQIARQARAFLGRAVTYLAGEVGVRQFLDIGTELALPEAGVVTADQLVLAANGHLGNLAPKLAGSLLIAMPVIVSLGFQPSQPPAISRPMATMQASRTRAKPMLATTVSNEMFSS